jgi:beta-N-acetylhexosaminidase
MQDKNEKTAELIETADWIIFAMLDVAPLRAPNSNAVSRFLREYGNELGDQRLVVLALNAPYFLDATEMSRLTTYFGVYSKIDPFLESSVRALFRSYTASGAPPVSVPGTRFASLAERLSPDANRAIPLQAQDADGAVLTQNGAAAVEDSAPSLRSGDTVRIVAGPILDMNGNTVPDGTPVIFRLQFDGDDLALAVEPALSQTGSAAREILLDRGGLLRVSATAGAATSGEPIVLNVAAPPAPPVEEGNAADAAGAVPAPGDRTTVLTLLIALLPILVTLSLFLIVQVRVLPRVALVHNLLWAAIFGLAGYLLYGVGLFPGGAWLSENVGVWGATVVVFMPMLLPLLWLQLRGEGKQ